MKIVYNNNWGGFAWPFSIAIAFNLIERYDPTREDRCNPEIIEALQTLNDRESGDLAICEIPDEATDWMVIDYDGRETVYYVFNGQLYSSDEDGTEKVN